jgi:hypothetical protein
MRRMMGYGSSNAINRAMAFAESKGWCPLPTDRLIVEAQRVVSFYSY